MERKVRCEECQNGSPSDICDDCRRALQSRGWRRFAEAMQRGIDDEDRKTLH